MCNLNRWVWRTLICYLKRTRSRIRNPGVALPFSVLSHTTGNFFVMICVPVPNTSTCIKYGRILCIFVKGLIKVIYSLLKSMNDVISFLKTRYPAYSTVASSPILVISAFLLLKYVSLWLVILMLDIIDAGRDWRMNEHQACIVCYLLLIWYWRNVCNFKHVWSI